MNILFGYVSFSQSIKEYFSLIFLKIKCFKLSIILHVPRHKTVRRCWLLNLNNNNLAIRACSDLLDSCLKLVGVYLEQKLFKIDSCVFLLLQFFLFLYVEIYVENFGIVPEVNIIITERKTIDAFLKPICNILKVLICDWVFVNQSNLTFFIRVIRIILFIFHSKKTLLFVF